MKCLICQEVSETAEQLELHFKSHELSEIQRFPCQLCKLKFLRSSTLEKHLRLVHGKKGLSPKNTKDSEALKEEAQKLLDEDSRHQPTDAGNQEESEHENVGTAPENIVPPKQNKQKIYSCEIESCSKTFRHLSSFIMHGKCVHSDVRSFTCEICSKSFKTSSNLNVHVKMHKNQRDHKCTLCPQAFFTTSHLKAHMKIHLKQTNYKCEECQKAFIHLSSYKKHQNFHSGIKSHHCRICDRDFSQVCHLREHLRTHSNERNHKCDKCCKAFRRPDTLRVHKKTHES